MSTLGIKLRQLRDAHNLTQEEIAEELGVTQTTYGCWESDKYSPRRDNLTRISQYYHIDIS